MPSCYKNAVGKTDGKSAEKQRERQRFEMRLTDEDRRRLQRLSHREGERDLSKVVREALIHFERSDVGR